MMRPSTSPDSAPTRDAGTLSATPKIGFLPILLANVVPLIGVLALGWNPATLIAVYVLELLVLFPLAGVKALFAARPPQRDRENGVVSVTKNDLVKKRGSVTIHPSLPPVFPRNFPFATSVVAATGWIVVFLSATISTVVPLGAALGDLTVLLSVAALVVGHLVETWRDYFRVGGYAETSPYAVVETPARQTFFLVFLLMALAGPAEAMAAGSTIVLAAFVGVKLLVEWSSFRASSGEGGRLARWIAGPSKTPPVSVESGASERSSASDAPQIPDAPISAVVSVDSRSARLQAALRTVLVTLPFHAPLALVILLGMISLLGDDAPTDIWVTAVLGVVGLFAVGVLANVVTSAIKRDSLEYRRRGDWLVAYDTRLEQPQWSASVDRIREVSVDDAQPVDRRRGTRTFTATTGWGDDETERTIGPVSEPDRLVSVFEFPIRSVEFDPVNRWLAAVALVAGVLLVAVPVAALTTPVVPGMVLLYAVFSAPFLVAIPRGIWLLARRV